MSSDVLTIGMATRGEPDHVWFVLTALHANHPKVEYLVVDNTPERDPRVEAITRAVGGTYYHRPDLTGTSAPRGAVFRFARTPWAVCLDSHVVLETGAVRAALDFIARDPESADIVSGPMVYDDGRGYATHWQTQDAPGLWGTWATDPRGADPAGAPFEVPAMGLGLWMMRVAAWPGFHPRFRGFGAEEGYVHEVVRRRGGKALCVPGLRWRHKFRDVGGWHNNPPPPYPLRADDMVWNQLLAHRELGVPADPQIRARHGAHMTDESWHRHVRAADATQPFGGPRPEVKRQKVLALWYSDNSAPGTLLQRSAASVLAARAQALRHDVTVSACAWGALNGLDFGAHFSAFKGEKRRGYGTIVAQIRQALERATENGEVYDAVAFCEHDVLYPPDYFDRIGDALVAHPGAPVVSNLDYIGLNGTGWQRVRERHEPLHQLTLRWDVFQENLERCAREAAGGGPVELEPYRHTGWDARFRIAPPDPSGMTGMPAVHVNREGAFTAHGAVCYEPRGAGPWHPHWGEVRHWWPGEMGTVTNVNTGQFKGEANPGCGACAARAPQGAEPIVPRSVSELFAAARAVPSDFHEHADTLRDLAAACAHATELSHWYKSADAALAHGVGAGTFVSVCPGAKPSWSHLRAEMGARFKAMEAAPAGLSEIDETDLLFIDTDHTANALMPLLEAHHARVSKYLVVHCTETYGESGDRPNSPGVMHALRAFCRAHPEWVVKRHDRNNHGLMILSKCSDDVKELPSLWRKAMNYTAAMIRHKAAGSPVVSLEVLEERQRHCATCEERALDACAACGCPLEAKLPLATETCGLAKKGQEPRWEAVAGAE